MLGFKKKEESYSSIVKYAMKKFIEIESNQEGIVNLIFGILLFMFISALCVPVAFSYIIKFFYPNCDIMMPWYGAFCFFAMCVLYFYLCAAKVMNIMSKRKEVSSKQKK